jgi:hypothetical protein
MEKGELRERFQRELNVKRVVTNYIKSREFEKEVLNRFTISEERMIVPDNQIILKKVTDYVNCNFKEETDVDKITKAIVEFVKKDEINEIPMIVDSGSPNFPQNIEPELRNVIPNLVKNPVIINNELKQEPILKYNNESIMDKNYENNIPKKEIIGNNLINTNIVPQLNTFEINNSSHFTISKEAELKLNPFVKKNITENNPKEETIYNYQEQNRSNNNKSNTFIHIKKERELYNSNDINKFSVDQRINNLINKVHKRQIEEKISANKNNQSTTNSTSNSLNPTSSNHDYCNNKYSNYNSSSNNKDPSSVNYSQSNHTSSTNYNTSSSANKNVISSSNSIFDQRYDALMKGKK